MTNTSDGRFIYEPNYITAAECATLLDAGQRLAPQVARLPEVFWDNRVLYLNTIERNSSAVGLLMRKIAGLMVSSIAQYWELEALYVDSVQIVRWDEGTELTPHADAANADGSEHNTKQRSHAAVILLNDDFSGGQLYLPRQGFTLPTHACALVAFSSGFECEHGVRKVTRGTRYTMASWYTTDPAMKDRTFY